MCERDDGKLWGKSICGPIMFVDSASRVLVANRRPGEGTSAAVPGVFASLLPPKQTISNTSIKWNGLGWSQVMWPLPDDPVARRILLAHESFHRLQDELGLTLATPGGNAHLDTLKGRLWLQLEWRALARALKASGAARRQAVEDALSFRAERRKEFSNAAKEERRLELGEGLAQYTGIKLAAADAQEQESLAVRELELGAGQPSYVRSFAYASGPAYGLLLDETGVAWRTKATRELDLAEALGQAYRISIPRAVSSLAEARAPEYQGTELRKAEEAREAECAARVAEYRRKLVEGPVLRLPLIHPNLQFDPRTLVPLGPKQTVYPKVQLIDAWGTLDVNGALLVDWEAHMAVVPAPVSKTEPLSTPEWSLVLEQGWTAEPDQRPGDFRLRKQ